MTDSKHDADTSKDLMQFRLAHFMTSKKDIKLGVTSNNNNSNNVHTQTGSNFFIPFNSVGMNMNMNTKTNNTNINETSYDPTVSHSNMDTNVNTNMYTSNPTIHVRRHSSSQVGIDSRSNSQRSTASHPSYTPNSRSIENGNDSDDSKNSNSQSQTRSRADTVKTSLYAEEMDEVLSQIHSVPDKLKRYNSIMSIDDNNASKSLRQAYKDKHRKQFWRKIIYFLSDLLTFLFGIKMFQLLPMHILALIWSKEDTSDNLIPFAGIDQVLGAFFWAFITPSFIIIIVLSIYLRYNQKNVGQYLKLTAQENDVEIDTNGFTQYHEYNPNDVSTSQLPKTVSIELVSDIPDREITPMVIPADQGDPPTMTTDSNGTLQSSHDTKNEPTTVQLTATEELKPYQGQIAQDGQQGKTLTDQDTTQVSTRADEVKETDGHDGVDDANDADDDGQENDDEEENKHVHVKTGTMLVHLDRDLALDQEVKDDDSINGVDEDDSDDGTAKMGIVEASHTIHVVNKSSKDIQDKLDKLDKLRPKGMGIKISSDELVNTKKKLKKTTQNKKKFFTLADLAAAKKNLRKVTKSKEKKAKKQWKENYLRYLNHRSTMKCLSETHREKYIKLQKKMVNILESETKFLKFIIVLEFLGSLNLFLGRLSMSINYMDSQTFGFNSFIKIFADWSLIFNALGFSGFILKIMCLFVRLQIRTANEAVNLRHFKFLCYYHSFNITHVIVCAVFLNVTLQSFGNFVDISWKGEYSWVGYLLSFVYFFVSCTTFCFAWGHSSHDKTKIDTNSRKQMSSYVWKHLNFDVFNENFVKGSSSRRASRAQTRKKCKISRPKPRLDVTLQILTNISVLSTLFLIVQFPASPVSLYRRCFTDTRQQNPFINLFLISMLISTFFVMFLTQKVVQHATSHVFLFTSIRIIWTFCLVFPYYINQIDRNETKSQLIVENETILFISQICTFILMILSPILFTNINIAIAKMLVMPHLHLLIGLSIGIILVSMLKVMGIVFGAKPFSIQLGNFLVFQCFTAFFPMTFYLFVKKIVKKATKRMKLQLKKRKEQRLEIQNNRLRQLTILSQTEEDTQQQQEQKQAADVDLANNGQNITDPNRVKMTRMQAKLGKKRQSTVVGKILNAIAQKAILEEQGKSSKYNLYDAVTDTIQEEDDPDLEDMDMGGDDDGNIEFFNYVNDYDEDDHRMFEDIEEREIGLQGLQLNLGLSNNNNQSGKKNTTFTLTSAAVAVLSESRLNSRQASMNDVLSLDEGKNKNIVKTVEPSRREKIVNIFYRYLVKIRLSNHLFMSGLHGITMFLLFILAIIGIMVSTHREGAKTVDIFSALTKIFGGDSNMVDDVYSYDYAKHGNESFELNIVTYNAHLGYNRRYEFGSEAMVDEIKKHENDTFPVDFLCLQEVGASNWEMGSIDILDYFGSYLGLSYGSYGSSQIATNGFNVAILSRYPIKKLYKYNLPNPLYQSNMIVAELNIELKNYQGISQPNGIIAMCAHFSTENKTHQVNAVHQLVSDYSQENQALAAVADWNIDTRFYCQKSGKGSSICSHLLNNDDWTHAFYSYFAETLNLSYTETLAAIDLQRSERGMEKLLDYGFVNYFWMVEDYVVMEHEKCFDVCLIGGKSSFDCTACSASDHLGVGYKLSLL